MENLSELNKIKENNLNSPNDEKLEKQEQTAKEPLKVLEAMDVYLPDVDGVINCMHNYCLNLNGYCKVTALAPKHKNQDKVKVPYKILRCKSTFVPILRDQYGHPNKDKEFKQKVYADEYDIIHLHSPFNMAKFAVKLAKERNIPAVITYHSNIKDIIKKYAKFNWLTNFILKKIGKIYNEFDRVFVVSELVAKQARECGYTGKIELLPFGTDLEKVSEEEINKNRAKANEQFGLNEDDLVFLYVGRVVELKRIDFTLKALKILKDKGYKFKFFVVGKGSALNKLQNLADKLGFSNDEVIFTGFLERELLPLINSRADLLLFPSIYDNFGLVKVEAATYNTAGVFVEDSCAGADVEDNFNGFLTKNDVSSYANTIIRAISDRDNLRKVGKRAGDSLYINWKDCTDQLYQAYERIIKEYNNKN